MSLKNDTNSFLSKSLRIQLPDIKVEIYISSNLKHNYKTLLDLKTLESGFLHSRKAT